ERKPLISRLEFFEFYIMRRFLPVFLLLIFGASMPFLQAQDSSGVRMSYINQGFQLATDNGNYKAHVQARVQFRYSTPFDDTPTNNVQLMDPATQAFQINRARLKIRGHAYRPYLKYYIQYELNRGTLND